MGSPESKRKRLVQLFKPNKSKKETVLQESADESESSSTQPGPVDPKGNRSDKLPETQADQRAHNSAKSDSTWDLAAESLRQKRPELYTDLQDLRNAEGPLSSSAWVEKELAECRKSRDDAYVRSRTNTEKTLRSILVYKDVAIAVSRLDPHGIAPIVLTGVCVVVQAALNGFKNHEEVTAAVETIAALVARWTNQERRSLLQQDDALKDDFAKLQTSLVDLYVSILECQLSLTRYCNGHIFRRIASAAYGLDLLRTQVTAIKDKDNNCKSYLSDIDAETAFQKRNAEILQWISPTDPMLMHEDITARTKITTKYTDSGEWLLKSLEFTEWDGENSKDQVLWLFGTVGTGKTTLMSKLVERHLLRSSLYSKSPYAVYYCSDSSGQRSSDSTVILRSLVRQLSWCPPSTVIAEPVQMIYDRLKHDRQKDGLLSRYDCEKLLQAIFESHVGARVYIDALDECDDPEEVLSVLSSISTAGKGSVKIFICSRTDLRYRAEDYFPDACFMEVASEKTKIDMENYIQREVQAREQHLRLLKGKYPQLEDELIHMLCQRAGGMFRWVELQLSLFFDRKRPFRHPGDVKDSLKLLEKVSVAGEVELSKTYSEIFDRNATSGRRDRRYAQAAYSIVLYAFRVMTLHELAMTVKWHCDKEEDDDGMGDNNVTPTYISTICRDCLTESTSRVVEFAHVSVKEYLQARKDGDELEYSFEKCHELIAKICFRYLLRAEQNLTNLKGRRMYATWTKNKQEDEDHHEDDNESDERNDNENDSNEDRILISKPYADYYWPAHVKVVEGYMSNDVSMEFSKFIPQDLEPSLAYQRWAQTIRATNSYGLQYRLSADAIDRLGWKLLSAASLPTTPIAAICAFGFLSMMGSLNELSSFDWNREQSSGGRTTKMLHISSEEGQAAVVTLLLARPDVDVNRADRDGRTALHRAAERGQAAVVTLLLARPDVDVNRADRDGETALHRAAEGGQAAVVTLLLARPDVDVNRADRDGWTALHRAARRGEAAVVTLLLARPDVNVNWADGDGWTALHWAAVGGQAAVVTLLLARPDVNVNRADEDGGTALYQAAVGGQATVVTLLLARPDVDVNRADRDGRTALYWAARQGQATVVTLLLARPDVDVNRADRDGRTALYWAARQGQAAVVTLLLARPDVDVNRADEDGRTALHRAARRGDAAVVTLLLARPDVDTNRADGDGRTALHWAARGGQAAVVTLLLARPDVDVNRADGDGETALHRAADNGHAAVVMLLEGQ